ncbi:MAG: potassium channel family protein [Bacilli bacterium]
MRKKEFAVIGLGRFGSSICRELARLGMDVMAIDMNEDRVSEIAPLVSHAVVADTTEETALKSLGIRNFDHVIVAIGDDIQSSILTTLILKELGVERITVKAQNDYHEKVLSKIGADHIVHPERDMGRRIAHNIVSNVVDHLELSDRHSIVELIVGPKLVNQTLIQLDLRKRYNLNVIAIRRGDDIIVTPSALERIQDNDVLCIIGEVNEIEQFERFNH